jgi:hypothetical protein
VIVPSLLLLFQAIFVNIASVRAVGDYTDRAFFSLLNNSSLDKKVHEKRLAL